ncbi:hypothetical protein [Salinispora arenicola]|uniref:hypothetical protein n=1 Tax=Salinispora arenicola TaxID=168697 RepID=UPI0003799240|nr:hypothetical protein [Salinispora arenicola]
MNDQRHDHEPDRPGTRRARTRWWNVGLAAMTGLALTTTLGIGGAPATGAVDGTLTATDDRLGRSDRASTDNKGHEGKGKKDTRTGTPVPCSADALIAAITLANARGGAVLDLAKDCTYQLTADIDDGAGLPAITTPITLNGGTHTTITRAAAAPLFRIITVDAGGKLTLNHMKITGGQTAAGVDGGGILVNPGGAATIVHSTIVGNISGRHGGGVANTGTTTIRRGTVSRNTASIEGGGIYNTGLLTVGASHVHANSGFGGGIASAGGTVQITHSTLAANQSTGAGGALRSVNTITSATDSHLTANTAVSLGGGIAALSGQLTLRDVTLADNATNDGGGGLSVTAIVSTLVEDSVIMNNTAATDGGGIYNAGEAVVRRTKVTGNKAGDEAGGIYNDSAGTLTLFSTKIVKNTAVTDGGGIFNNGGIVNLNTATGTIVIKNRPNNCVNVAGCPG